MDPKTQPEIDIDQVPITSLERYSTQWRALYEHKLRLHDVSIKQIILGQIFTLLVAMAAGVFLAENRSALLFIGTTLVLYPALADMLSSNAAVLSTSIHHDIDNLSGSKLWAIIVAIAKTMFVSILASMILGVFAGLVGVLFFETAFLETVRLATLAGAISGLIGMPIMAGATLIVRNMQVNPDDVTAPIETAIFNSLTLAVMLFIASSIT